ncbi:MAG TPA: hypothetical protein VFI76_01930 [Terrimicrobiaceae bacterium]|nr:hypothetical protein [Terrimicrobiaceae bacterium]
MSFGYVTLRDDIDQAAALRTVGVDSPPNSLEVSQTTRQNGRAIIPEVTFFFQPKTRDGTLATQILQQAWGDVEAAELGENSCSITTDATTRYEELGRKLVDTEDRADRAAIVREMEILLPCVMLTVIHTFLINRDNFRLALEQTLPSHERTGKIDKRKRQLEEAVKQYNLLTKAIKRLRRDLTEKPAKWYPVQVRLIDPDLDRNEPAA